MQKLINQQITETINIKKLRGLIPNYCRVVKYDQLKNKKTLAEVMGKHEVLIVLWNIHDKQRRVLDEPGHFFVLSTRGPEPLVVFSSTGMKPSEELFLTQSDPKLFERILPKNTSRNWLRYSEK